jgi:hypothetical protein
MATARSAPSRICPRSASHSPTFEAQPLVPLCLLNCAVPICVLRQAREELADAGRLPRGEPAPPACPSPSHGLEIDWP